MNQNIIIYLRENKEKYPKDVLAAELRKSGYVEGDIAEGVAQVFDGLVAPVAPAIKTSFWNFKDKKVYTSTGQKWADFLFGVFGVLLVGSVSVALVSIPISVTTKGYMFPPRFLDVGIFLFCLSMFFLWIAVLLLVLKCRRSMFYGILVSGFFCF